MTYQALYRVWRPKTFEDVVGQGHITQTLQNAIRQEMFSHAYIFSGPRGTGKTSAAKIFAKTINCEQAPVSEPCNECASCRGIQDGSISDIIEMDAASNTSVEDVREIRDKVKYAASSVPYKVYIIDEVHMISTSAFNALLKTLEEPPKHVVFILATTEPHKIPLTVASRCQRFDFKPISNQTIVDRLRTVIESEGIAVTDDALGTVALTAEGGMRDALSVLDQAISYSGDQVELDDVLTVTGGVAQGILTDVVRAMYASDAQKALSLLDELIQNGKDPARFVYDLIYFLRDVLLYKSAPSLERILERAIADEPFEQLARDAGDAWLQEAITRLNQCQQEIKWSTSPKVFIEIAILAITNQNSQTSEADTPVTQAADTETVTKLTGRIEQLEKELTNLKEAPASAASQAPANEPKRSAPRPAKNGYKVPHEKIRRVLDAAERPILKEIQSQWASFLSQLKSTSAPAHATIQDSKPAAASSDSLVVQFKYDIHCSLFLDNRETVESVLTNVTGKKQTIIPIPAKEWQELRNDYISKQETAEPNDDQQEEESLITEARKLAGDDLLEIHDE
ncbi:DNA polymerase III subunit gamma/tau [Barrientosiimonas marina]|uniref:DNA-directed DNA polymerase n=1 Tax=Lentibacillus kimchii TaxID=1542911 RepID=A0ABW2UVB0_9BACI